MNSFPNLAVDAASSGVTTRPRVLVADDSRVSRLTITKILGTDFDIVQAENGALAWDQLSQDNSIQAVITDIQMPQMDGYEFICRVRASEDPRVRDLPVIAITGAEDETIKQQAMACGATDFITKPFDPLQLRARVQAYAHYDQVTRELTEATVSLEEQAITDPQTGLRSRRYLVQRGEQDIAYAQRHNQEISVLRIDIDDFKAIYRKHGDEMVDRFIAWVAKLLHSAARTEDTVARISGAEFAVLATNTGLNEAMPLCERIQSAMVAQPFSLGSVSIHATLSIGISSLKQDQCSTIEALIRLAHQRLCHARSEGGNRICNSIMDGSTTSVEEVMLTPLANLNVDMPVALDGEASIELSAPLPSGEASSSTDIEIELPPLDIPAVEMDARAPEPMAPSADLVSIDKALALIAQGKGRMLMPYVEALMREIKPLIELYERRHIIRK